MSLLLTLLGLTRPPPSLFARIQSQHDTVDAELLFQLIQYTNSSACLHFALKYLLATHEFEEERHQSALINAISNHSISPDDILSILKRLLSIKIDEMRIGNAVSTVLISYSSNKLIIDFTLKSFESFFSSQSFCNEINPYDLLLAVSKNMDDDKILGSLFSILSRSEFQTYAWRHTECKILLEAIKGREIAGRKLLNQIFGYVLHMLTGETRVKCGNNFMEAGAIRLIVPLLVPSEIIDVVLDVLYELLLIGPDGSLDSKTEAKICIYLERIQQTQPKAIIEKILEKLLPKREVAIAPVIEKFSLTTLITKRAEIKSKVPADTDSIKKPEPFIVVPPNPTASPFANLNAIIEQQNEADSFVRLEAAGMIKDMIIGSEIDNIDKETTTTIIEYLLSCFDDDDYILYVSASALSILSQLRRNREIIHSLNGLEKILHVIDSRFDLGVIEQALQCLYHFATQKDFCEVIVRLRGLPLLLIFNHSCHVNIREIALTCLERLIFYGGEDMKMEKDLIIANSIWEKVIQQWDDQSDWDDDNCMFKTFEAAEPKKSKKKKNKQIPVRKRK